MFKLTIFFFLVLLAFSAVSAFSDAENAIACFGNCIKNTESDKEDVKDCAKMCVGDAADDASKAFLDCESKCVDLFFNAGSDNSDNYYMVACNTECAKAFKGE
ncbi:unnamed protein product [Caenorhabditis nigoni]|uniref:Uncharacterized protein n=1 Tax=Caenorhabditis nigoni TaxID=1611254 RepID=A0A2G5T705_9PELO|nr:hypothetical protein B9Z55_016876 [Caenorhabditis nigoni]